MSVEAVVCGLLAERLGVPSVSTDARLAELGLSSIKVIRITAQIERQYGIELPDEEIFSCETVADLCSLVGRRVG